MTDIGEYRVMLGAALAVGITPVEVKEIVYQANLNVGNNRARLLDVIAQLLPYIGYPRTLNALRVINEVAPA